MFDKSAYFLNRELSWLKFNSRVLQEAGDKFTPVLERLRFIAITSSNLDEFFMIRVAGLKNQLDSGVNKTDASGMTVGQQLYQTAEYTQDLVKVQYRYLRGILQELESYELQFKTVDTLSKQGRAWVERYFNQTIYPVITPLNLAGIPLVIHTGGDCFFK